MVWPCVNKPIEDAIEWQPEKTVSSELNPLWVPIGEKGAAAEAAPHREDEDNEAALGHETALPAPLSSQPTAEILEADRAAYVQSTVLRAKRAFKDAAAMLII